MTVYSQAMHLIAAGISVVPIKPDGSKEPACGGWKTWQHRLPAEYLAEWFARTNNGIAIVCGKVSGNVECLDFDAPNAYAEWSAILNDDHADLLERLVVTRTPGPGMQAWYRCAEPVPGNTKLARLPKEGGGWETLIETRGEGGYALVPPTGPECHPNKRGYSMFRGDLIQMPTLTFEERLTLIDAARSLNRYVEPERATRPPRASHRVDETGSRPGDLYNAKGCWESLLARHGWVVERRRDPVIYWRRPGKAKGISATLHAVAPGIFYVFSGNAAPFEQERSYDLFGAFALLEHGGDFKAATQALAAQGFGDPPKARQQRVPDDHEAPPVATAEVGDYELSPFDTAPEIDATGWEDVPEPDDSDSPEGGPAPKVKDAKLAAEWADSVREQFCFVEGDEWREYREHCWQAVSDSTIDAHILPWLKANRKAKSVEVTMKRIGELRRQASIHLGEGNRPHRRQRFDAQTGMIPLANGMLVVETRQLVEHSPAHRNTYTLPYAYDAGATCPRFDQFLAESMRTEDGEVCDEWVELLIDWLGYSLIPDCRAETVLVNVGEGGNGKSVFLKIMEGLVGDCNAVSIDPIQLGRRSDYSFAAMYGKLIGFLNEPMKKQLMECAGTLKALVSGDLVEARAPYKQAFSYRPHLRLTISCNDMFETRDLSKGFFRRLLLVEWRNRPENPDPSLDQKLVAEMPGILNLALDGLDRVRGRGFRFPEPEESQKLKAEYRASQDTVAQFLEECCQCDPSSVDIWCVPAELYARYAAWAKGGGYTPLTIAAFGTHLTKRLGYPPAKNKKVPGSDRTITVRYGILPMATPLREEEYPVGG